MKDAATRRSAERLGGPAAAPEAEAITPAEEGAVALSVAAAVDVAAAGKGKDKKYKKA